MRNNLSLSGLSEFANEVREAPEEAEISYGVNLTWETATRSAVKTKPMKVGPHKVSRSFSWKVDEPRQLLGANHGPNPQELMLSGLGACIMVAFVVGATAKGVQLDSLEVDVEGDLNLSGFLGLGGEGPMGFPKIRYTLKVMADAPKDLLEEIHLQAVAHSPNAMTIANPVSLEGTLNVDTPE
ncbi:OsmC family protein [Kordiimonas pumila]|uniref:OsmC family protein n=1 Tax=Kordiimonas pumila TaxID=2161677 RepID=A0ABV7D521_9PROT|nr:OsmC family protein [Kordiimonas pumila]